MCTRESTLSYAIHISIVTSWAVFAGRSTSVWLLCCYPCQFSSYRSFSVLCLGLLYSTVHLLPCFVLLCSTLLELLCSAPLYFAVLCSALFCSALFYRHRLCSVLFYCILLFSVMLCSIWSRSCSTVMFRSLTLCSASASSSREHCISYYF
jgi:hypothetical protein